MNNIGSSTFKIDSLFVDLTPYRGATGPTGPTGDTGPIGPVGNTGPAGSGVYYILKNGSNGITVYLYNGNEFTVQGISGNTFDVSTALPYYYQISGSTGTIPNQSFEIKGGVIGLTAYFKPIKAVNGLTVSYSGNNLKFSVVSSAISIGEAGNILIGTTGNVVTNGPYLNTFQYSENTFGITTVPILKGKLSNFIQRTVSTNENLSTTNTLSNLISGNTYNISFSQYKVNSNASLTNRITDNTEYSKAGITLISRKSYTTNYTLLDLTKLTTYQVYKYGSCCFCNTDSQPTCLDYVNKAYCDTLNGSFSFVGCQTRTDSSCRSLGKCCVGGVCLDLEYSDCQKLNGIFDGSQLCGNSTC